MSLPYRWRPEGVDRWMLIDKIEPGTILAYDHAVYRVIERHPKPEDEVYPWRLILRPIAITGDDPRDRDHDRAIKVVDGWRCYNFTDEHYPVCAKCQEPLPCREQMAAKESAKAAESLDRYSVAGVCPACDEPVTARQKAITWQENVVNPIGPPVTIHLRRACWGAAVEYEKRWHAADPEHRPLTMSCPGSIVHHHDGTHDCTEPACPGGDAQHPAQVWHYPRYSDCHCVAGIPTGTEARAEQDQERDLLRLFEDES
jgi:hypothetical protein